MLWIAECKVKNSVTYIFVTGAVQWNQDDIPEVFHAAEGDGAG